MQFLIFSVLLHALCASAAPYLITSYVELSIYTYRAGTTRTGVTTRAESLETLTEAVQLPTSVTAAPAAITTYTTADPYYTHVSIVNVVLSKGVGQTIPYSTYQTGSSSETYYTTYMVPVTYHAPTSCGASSWDFVATVSVYVPPPVKPTMTAAATTTSASTYSVAHLNPEVTTRVYLILDPKDVDADDLSSASASYATRNYQLSRCTSPTVTGAFATSTGSSGSSSISPSSSSSRYDDYYDSWFRTYLIIAIAVPVGWVVIFLFLGLLESWISFKGLMLGQQRKRGLPYSWCCIIVWTLCFTGPTYKARSVEEQAVLKEKWAEMGFGRKLKLWFQWGFRWKYPVDLLGVEPEISKRAFRQGCL